MTLRTAGRVAWIHVAPVKGMALVALDTADLTATGIEVDRRFCVLDPAGRIQNGKVAGPLVRIAPDYDAGAGTLALRFPDGTVVRAPVEVGEPVLATFSGRPRDARVVRGPWAEAVSDWAGRPFRIARFDGHGRGVDRGADGGATTLVSTAALATMADWAGVDRPLDGRRFRMTFGIDGLVAFAEEGWLGRTVRVGSALVRPLGNVGRCAVTTQDPDRGVPTLDTLRLLADHRRDVLTTEALPFGVWAEVLEPGRVALGETVGPAE